MIAFKKSDLQTAFIFAIGGLGAGMVSARLIFRGVAVGIHHFLYFFILWPGLAFLTALSFCFFLCKEAGWPGIMARPLRSSIAAILIGCNTCCSVYGGLFAGVVAAILISQPPTAREAPFAHSFLFFSAPVIFGLLFGAFLAAILLALALYIFTQVWDPIAWRALLLSGAAATIAALATNPTFLLILRVSTEGKPQTPMIFERTFSTLLIMGYMLYGTCAGYWLARSPDGATS
jgi:hypothetical protein